MLRSTTRAILRPSLATPLPATGTCPCFKPRLPLCWYSDHRPFSSTCTASSSKIKSSRKTGTKAHSKPKSNAPIILAENKCAQVWTWDVLRNPAEAFALIRAVEQRYGPVESFSFQKDLDSTTTYQNRVNLTFRSIESFNRLPQDFETLHIRTPKVQSKRPGGIGLDEIEPLLSGEVEFLTASQVSEMGHGERTIDFRIQRAPKPLIVKSPYPPTPLNRQYRKAVGFQMLQWGGFHPMEPIDSTQPITNEDLTNETMDHVYMRRALREWAKYCDVRNPFEIYPKEEGMKNEVSEAAASEAVAEVVKEELRASDEDVEDWLEEVGHPRVVQDPMERILAMEDIQIEPKVSKTMKEEPQFGGSAVSSSESSATPTSTSTSPEDMIARTSPAEQFTYFTESAPVSPQSQNAPSVPTDISPTPKDSISPTSTTPEDTIPQPTYPKSETPLSPPTPATLTEPSEARDTMDIQAQMQEHQPQVSTMGSEDQLQSETEDKKPEDSGAEGEESESELKENPRFGNLYSRLQEILKKSS